MRSHIAVLAALTLVATGCGRENPAAQPPSTTSVPTTTTTTTATTTPTTTTPTTTSSEPSPTRTPNPRPLAAASSNAKDCFDGDCVLVLSKPATIRLDAKALHYSSMRVTAISATSLSYNVTFPGGGGSSSTIGPGVGGGGFGFRGSPLVEVGLTTVDGKPALVLQPGPIVT